MEKLFSEYILELLYNMYKYNTLKVMSRVGFKLREAWDADKRREINEFQRDQTVKIKGAISCYE